ncbi:MAG: hypothetical protein ACTSWY_08790 [Promethearchaeota archaeon]
MGWLKIIFYFAVIYFDFTLLNSNILLGVVVIGVEILFFLRSKRSKIDIGVNLKGDLGQYNNRGYDLNSNLLVTLQMMNLEREMHPSNRSNNNGMNSQLKDEIFDSDSDSDSNLKDQRFLSKTHKRITNIFNNHYDTHALNNRDRIQYNGKDLFRSIETFYLNEDYNQIIRTFLGLIRLRSKILLYQSGIKEINKKSKCYLLLRKVGDMLWKNTGIDYLFKKSYRVEKIEKRTENLPYSISDVTMKKDCVFLINIYFTIKVFDPEIINRNHKKKITRKKNPQLPNDLMYMGPLVKLIHENKKQQKFRSNFLSGKKGKNPGLISGNFYPVLNEYLNLKFNKEIQKAKNNLFASGDLNTAVIRVSELSSAKETMPEIDAELPYTSFLESQKYAHIKGGLLSFAGFMGSIAILMYLQISGLPGSEWYFGLYTVTFIVSVVICLYLYFKL